MANKSYDVVVIGAGNGGLAAAAQLAVNGVNVLLLEQHNVPGGFATSFVRGRFEFEPSLHQITDIGPKDDPGGLRKFFEKDLGLNLEWKRLPEFYRLVVTGKGEEMDVTVPFGYNDIIETIEGEVPGSKDSVTEWFELIQQVDDALVYLEETEGNPEQKVLIKQHANFLKTCPYNIDQVADKLQIPQKAKDILHAAWIYIGIPSNRLNFTFYAAMYQLFASRGGYVPTQYSHGYTTRMEKLIRDRGGKVQYNTRVTKVIVENGRVIGVETERGERFDTNHVISNASPTLMYNFLIEPKDEVPEIAFKECNARRNATSAFVVYLGLNAGPDDLGIENYSYFIYESADSKRMYETLKTISTPPILASACLNKVIPNCSPAGTTILSLTTLYLPEAWKGVRQEQYHSLKSKIAGELIDLFEKGSGTNIKEHIEEIEIATPLTFARYTGSYGGNIYGYEADPWDSFMPRMMAMDSEKHIKGIEFCGGYSANCHGYSSTLSSGQLAAFFTLESMSGDSKEGK
ncbi:MAG: phytoene desaturase family protein [Candidatus Hodarchaeota archaeon]